MKTKHKHAHMKAAHTYAECSSAIRLKVGALVVKDDRIISIGYNGMPSGWDNICEEKEWMPVDTGGWSSEGEVVENWPFVATSDTDGSYIGRYRLKTKPEVLHAEMNALMKLARSNESGLGASLFITHAPCIDCAKGIYQAGIKEVYFKTNYRSEDGINFLKKCGITIKQLTDQDE